ncbi:MAG: hypothetical protein RLZZ387_72 [Chloroflexota bacterium]
MSHQQTRAAWRGLLSLALLFSVFAAFAGVRPAVAATSELFISEYVEGSSNNKALEIYNGTGSAVNLGAAGYNVQMYFNGSATATLTINLVGTIASGDVFVIVQSSANAALLAQADQTNGSGWYNGDDAVVLRKGTTVVDVIGQIGFDPGTEWGSGLTSTADNTLRRKIAVTAGDTNGSNAFDPSAEWDGFAIDVFGGVGSHSLTSDDVAPVVASSVPANGATNVSAGTSVTVNFSEAVSVNTSQVTLECPAGAPVMFNVVDATDISSLVIDPVSNLPFNTTCALTIPAGAVSDVDGNDPPDTLVATFSTGFTTEANPCLLPATKVSEIQGSGLTSLRNGQSATVQGVVTAVFAGLRGFYLQEEPSDYDASPATSEGLFVFTISAPSVAVGDQVRVSGTVAEFPANSTASITQLTGPAITDCGPGETIPVTDVSFPLSSLSALEVYEGMLVRFPQELFIAEYFNYDRFGEIVLGYAGDLPELGGQGRFFTPTSITAPGAAANALAAQYSLRRITLDDGVSASAPSAIPHPNGLPFSATNRFRGGDTVTGQIGVIDNSFGIYRVHLVQAGVYEAVNQREETPPQVGGTLKVASYNVLNYFLTVDNGSGTSNDICGPLNGQDCRGADSAAEFERQRSKLIAALKALDADIYGLIELENTTGVEPLADLVSGLNDATAPGTFAYIDTGTIGTDAIKVGIIYKPANVSPVGAYQTLDEQDDPRFSTSRNRPALAQTFAQPNGARFTVVVNHLKSKGSACSEAPDQGDGQGNCNGVRLQAARALVDWLAKDPTGSGDADFLIMGDLNSYAKEDPITAIKQGADDAAGTSDDYINLIADRLGAFAYSYVFDGQAGYLDHAMASSTLSAQVSGVADWHLNSDEPDILDYNDTLQDPGENPNGSERKGLDVTDVTSPFRTADHDPVIIGLNLTAYSFDGFFQPIDNVPAINAARAGSAIPVKFSLGADRGLAVLVPGFPISNGVPCALGAAVDGIEETVTAGGSSLAYDPATGQYTYVWKTDRAWAGTCRDLVVVFKDGTVRRASFTFTR